jgi:hypothetical protein
MSGWQPERCASLSRQEPVPACTGMNVLPILAHPSLASYTARSVEAITRGAVTAGHRVELADLFLERFELVLNLDDFAQFTGNLMPADVLREQARVDRNDALVLAFPVYWWSSRPCLKAGWTGCGALAGRTSRPSTPEHLQKSRPCVVLCSAARGRRSLTGTTIGDPFEHLLRVRMLSYAASRTSASTSCSRWI